MRQHRSIWMLLARSTFRWVLVIALLLALAQGVLFWRAMERAWDDAREAEEWFEERSGHDRPAEPQDFIWSMETVWNNSRASAAFGVAAVLTAAVLVAFGSERNVKVSYTFRRLSVSEKSVFVWQAIYNTLCFLLLWALEVFIALALCKWYVVQVGAEAVSHQATFLAFHRNQFLHNLMPLEDVACWVRNGLLCLSLGVIAAWDTWSQRRSGKVHAAIVCALGLAAWAFLNDESGFGPNVISMAASVFVTLVACYGVFLKGEEYDEKV